MKPQAEDPFSEFDGELFFFLPWHLQVLILSCNLPCRTNKYKVFPCSQVPRVTTFLFQDTTLFQNFQALSHRKKVDCCLLYWSTPASHCIMCFFSSSRLPHIFKFFLTLLSPTSTVLSAFFLTKGSFRRFAHLLPLPRASAPKQYASPNQKPNPHSYFAQIWLCPCG